MKKKLFLVLGSIFLLSFAQTSFASVVINEVQIETDTNKDNEFIELYNNSTSEVDLTGFSIYKKTSSGTESSIVSKTRFENNKIPANGILFLAREGEYIGTKNPDIFWPTSYSLAQNNSLILYKDFENKIIEHQVSWGEVSNFKLENNNSNNNENSNSNNTENTNTGTTTTGGSSLSASSQPITKKNPELKILAKNFGFVGQPINFESIILNEEYRNIYGKYFWNFGDGESKEFSSLENIKFTHTYFYAGEYNVYLEYYRTTHEFHPYLTSQITINIVEPTLVISKTGEEGDFFIEVSNKSNMNLDLTNFTLKGKEKIFIFPKNTFLNKEKKIILSPKITNFNFTDKNFLEILDPSGKVIYSQKVTGEVKGISTKKISSSNKNFIPENIENTSQDFDENLDITKEEKTSNLEPYIEEENNWNIIWIFILVILGASTVVYFIRKSYKNKKENIDDEEFEILDE